MKDEFDRCNFRGVPVALPPDLMTSIAFIAGVTPVGAFQRCGGAKPSCDWYRRDGGMIAATLLRYFCAVFFVVMRKIFPGHARNIAPQRICHPEESQHE